MYHDQRTSTVNADMINRARRKSKSQVTIKIGDTTYKLADMSKLRMGLAKLGIITILGVSALANNVVETVTNAFDNAITWVSDSVDLQDEFDKFDKEVIVPNTFRTSSDGAYLDTVNYDYSAIAHYIKEKEASPAEGIYKVYSNDHSDGKDMTNEVVRILHAGSEINNLDDFIKTSGYSSKDEWCDATKASLLARLESGEDRGR